MKKKILASLFLLSTVLVSQVAVLTTVHAETTDEKLLLKIVRLVT